MEATLRVEGTFQNKLQGEATAKPVWSVQPMATVEPSDRANSSRRAVSDGPSTKWYDAETDHIVKVALRTVLDIKKKS